MLAIPVHAEPRVLYDTGASRPIEQYVPRLPSFEPGRLPSMPAQLPLPAPRFPVRTPELSPGQVTAHSVELPQLAGGHPFFLIGSDSFSREWIARRRAQLVALQALGMLVQAESETDVRDMQALAAGLPLTVLNASELARQLRLTHYPMLISSGAIEQ